MVIASIRFAVADDAETMAAMVREIAVTTDEEHLVHSTADSIRRDGFGDRPHFQALLAEVEAKVVGMSLFLPTYSTWRASVGGFIQDFYVAPEVRGTDVAAQLMAATAAAVQRSGGNHLRLTADAANATAKRFYERRGMQWADHEHNYFIDGGAFADMAGYESWRG